MMLKRLAAPRPVVLHNDVAFGEHACLRPIPVPQASQYDSDVEFAAAMEAHAVLAKSQPHREPRRDFFTTDEEWTAAQDAHAAAVARFDAWQRYMESYDMRHLPLVDGVQPLVFMIGQLRPEAAARIQDFRHNERGALFLHLVEHAVEDILNLETEDDQGRTGVLKVTRRKGPYGLRLDEDSMRIFTDQEVLTEVAAHVLRSTQLPRGSRKSH